MNLKLSIIAVIILSAGAGVARSEGLGTLIEVGKSQTEIQRAYDEETKSFERVRDAVDSGAIKKGDKKEDILNKYGEPVVILQDKEKNREKWVYKPAKSTFSEGARIKIFFDSGGFIDEIVKEG